MRTIELIQALLDDGGDSLNALTQRFGVSARTIRSHVHGANKALEGIASIRFSRKTNAYELEVLDEDGFQDWLARGTRIEQEQAGSIKRVPRILNYLLLANCWVRVPDLAERLFVSPQSVSVDLHEVEAELAKFGLSLVKRPRYGIRIEGPETNRRACLASVISSSIVGGAGNTKELTDRSQTIGKTVERVLRENSFSISSLAFQNLVVHLVVAVERIKQGCYVPMDAEQRERLMALPESIAARKLARAIENDFGMGLPSSEVAFITIHLAGKHSIDALSQEVDTDGTVISGSVWDVVGEILDAVYLSLRINLRCDLELRMNLARHIVPLSVRLRYGMPARNPLLEETKLRYPLAWSMALEAGRVLERHYGAMPNEDEIGFLALSFELSLERRRTPARKMRVLVVCASGMGSARLLRQRFITEFGELLERCDACDAASVGEKDLSEVDYIFSTVPLPDLPVPVCQISYFFDRDAENGIRRLLEGADARDVTSLFSRELFFPHVKARDKDSLLDMMCTSIVSAGLADSTLRESVAQRERAAATCFGNQVALPHPVEAKGDATVVAVALLDEPLSWDEFNHDVRAVFLVSYARSGSDVADAFDSLADLFVSKEAISELVNTQTWECLIGCLRKGSKSWKRRARHRERMSL